jgi:hypothetical protein
MRIGIDGTHAIHAPPLCNAPLSREEATKRIGFLARACRAPDQALIKATTGGVGPDEAE